MKARIVFVTARTGLLALLCLLQLLGSLVNSDSKQGTVQAVKLQAKADEVLEQAAEAMTGISSSLNSGLTVDESLALKAEAMVEADALADLEVEERLMLDQQQTTQENEQKRRHKAKNKDEDNNKEDGKEEMVQTGTEQKKKTKKKKKGHSKHSKSKHAKAAVNK